MHDGYSASTRATVFVVTSATVIAFKLDFMIVDVRRVSDLVSCTIVIQRHFFTPSGFSPLSLCEFFTIESSHLLHKSFAQLPHFRQGSFIFHTRCSSGQTARLGLSIFLSASISRPPISLVLLSRYTSLYIYLPLSLSSLV